MSTSAYERLVEHFGSQAEIARRVSAATGETISYQAVHKWRDQIPAHRCLLLEQMTGRAVTAAEMRPDVFVLATAETATATPEPEPATDPAGQPRRPARATATSANGDGSGRVGQQAA